MSKLPRFPPGKPVTGEDLNLLISALDAGGVIDQNSITSSQVTGQGLSQVFPTTPGSVSPAAGQAGAPQTPQGLTGTYGIDNFSQSHTAYVNLGWTPNPVADFISHYDIYWHKGSDPTLHNISVGGDVTSVRINDLFPGTTYVFAIQAHDTANRSSAWSPEVTIFVSSDADAPAVPTGFSAIGTVKGVALFWNEVGLDGISNDLKQYQIQIATDSTFSTYMPSDEHSIVVVSSGISNPNPWLITIGPGNTHFYPYWIDGTTLYFRIRSVDWTGNSSDWSSGVSAVVGASASSISSMLGIPVKGLVISASDSVVGNYNVLDFTNVGQTGAVARIGVKLGSGGSEIHFGTSNNYALGITTDAMQIDPSGNVSIAGTLTLGGNTSFPSVIQAETVAIRPQVYFATPANVTGVSVLADYLNMGLAGSITPSVTGRILFLITGGVANTTANDGADWLLAYGTGTAPTFASTKSGTPINISGTASNRMLNNASTANLVTIFSTMGIASGLTLGTPYWIDLWAKAVTGGSVSFFNITVIAIEI